MKITVSCLLFLHALTPGISATHRALRMRPDGVHQTLAFDGDRLNIFASIGVRRGIGVGRESLCGCPGVRVNVWGRRSFKR